MFSKINFKAYLIIVFTGTLLVGFQNCSKYNYDDISNTSVQGLSTDQLGDSSDTLLNQPSSIVTDSGNPPASEPEAQQPVVEMPAPVEPLSQDASEPVASAPSMPSAAETEEDEYEVLPDLPANNAPALSNPANPEIVAEMPPQDVPSNPVTTNEMPPSEAPPSDTSPVVIPPLLAELPPVDPVVPVIIPPLLPPVTPNELPPPPLAVPSEPNESEAPQETTEAPPVSPSPVVSESAPDNDDENCVKWAYEKKDQLSKVDVASDNSKKQSDSKNKKNESPEVTPNKCYVDDGELIQNNEYDKFCQMNKRRLSLVNAIGRVLNSLHLRGFTVITSDTAGADSIDSIEDVRGHLIVCDLEVKKIDNTRGLVTLINSKVGTLNNHRGAAVIYNSVVDNCTDIKGVISIIGDQAVCHNIQGSVGVVQVRRK